MVLQRCQQRNNSESWSTEAALSNPAPHTEVLQALACHPWVRRVHWEEADCGGARPVSVHLGVWFQSKLESEARNVTVVVTSSSSASETATQAHREGTPPLTHRKNQCGKNCGSEAGLQHRVRLSSNVLATYCHRTPHEERSLWRPSSASFQHRPIDVKLSSIDPSLLAATTGLHGKLVEFTRQREKKHECAFF